MARAKTSHPGGYTSQREPPQSFPVENHALVYIPEVLLVRPVPLVDEPQTQPSQELAELQHVHEALYERRSRLDGVPEDVAERTWEEGRALGMGEAVALARALVVAPLDRPPEDS